MAEERIDARIGYERVRFRLAAPRLLQDNFYLFVSGARWLRELNPPVSGAIVDAIRTHEPHLSFFRRPIFMFMALSAFVYVHFFTTRAEAEELMRAKGLPFFGEYTTGYIRYKNNDGSIEGLLFPLKLSSMAPIRVTGIKGKNLLTLDFHLGSETLRGEFGPLEGLRTWRQFDRTFTSGGDGITLEELDHEPSESALTIQERGCGGPTPGELVVEFDRDVLQKTQDFPADLIDFRIETLSGYLADIEKQSTAGDKAKLKAALSASGDEILLQEFWQYLRLGYLKGQLDLEQDDEAGDEDPNALSLVIPRKNNSDAVINEIKELKIVSGVQQIDENWFISFNLKLLEQPDETPDIFSNVILTKRPKKITLRDVWPLAKYAQLHARKGFVGMEIKVPFGSEATVATALSRSGLAKNIAYLVSGCAGGVDISVVMFPKSLIERNNVIDDDIFQATFTRAVSKALAAQQLKLPKNAKYGWRLGQARVTHNPLPPHFPLLELGVYADSYVTRKVNGSWDKFDLVFRPGDSQFNNADELSVEITVENMMTVTKGGTSEPPSDTWFKTVGGKVDEAVTTLSIAHLIKAPLNARCHSYSELAIMEAQDQIPGEC